VYTIRGVKMESVGQGQDAEDKPVVYFRETQKGLALNKTNANAIAQLYGPDTDRWTGKAVTLYPTEVEFQGKMTLAIRVRLRKPQPAAAATGGRRAESPFQEPAPEFGDGSEESQFPV
jgi:hypothetical protein